MVSVVSPALVVYGDFNCPYSALASERAARLEQHGAARVEWRCVEHDPSIGPDEFPMTGAHHDQYATEIEHVRALSSDGEADGFRVPSRRLNTRDINHTYASADSVRRAGLRQTLFAAYWIRDLDVTDDAVIESLVADVPSSLSDDESSSRSDVAEFFVRTWTAEWREVGRGTVPVVVTDAGTVARGLDALELLSELGRTDRVDA
ncbi:putative DsbA family dithiol-disulfide isomerase [Ilumatobacter fluminis]|uniref:Putative DsbA family dithiol-disulfide isomerase n=1 Tax=Ilumatobacter fluminis TaxID=467091 RepID=A0A4R7HYA4_9ACTN|nr:putative DsbA family dithiol-disulfide isomerase [Ilumatobacter fluminis]